jgi:uncharacterized membrane protein YbaN (DUF454 family)
VPLSVRSLVRNGLALMFFVLGVLGSVLPIMPGFVFFLGALVVMDVPQKRVALRRLQHSWLIQKLLQNRSFAQTWRALRCFARGSEKGHAASSQVDRV